MRLCATPAKNSFSLSWPSGPKLEYFSHFQYPCVTNPPTKIWGNLQLRGRTKHLYGETKTRCGLLPTCLRHAAKRAAERNRCRLAQKAKFMGGFMKLKLVVSLVAVVSLFGVSAYAQDTPKVDVFAGYSYVRNNPSTSGV